MKGLRVLFRKSALGLLAYLMISRIAGAAFPVAFVICIAHVQGYAAAAVAQAVSVFTLAGGAPLRARLLDIWGSRRVLPLQVVVSAACLIVMSVAIGHTKSLALIIGLSLLVSVSSPAIYPAVRTSWRSIADNDEQLAMLHTADSLIEEAGFLVGPALAATIMLTAGYQWAPIILAVAIAANNVIAFCNPAIRARLFASRSKSEPDQQTSTAGERAAHANPAIRVAHLIAGPILQGDLRAIVTPLMLMGGTFGVLAIALPDVAAHHGSMATAGFLTALISLGGLVGGLIYGTVRTRGTPRLRHSLLGIVFGFPAVLLCIARSPWSIAPILVISGLAVTPFYINSYLMIDALIAGNVKHEANSWVPVGNDVGYIIGISLGGLLVARVSLSAAMWLGAFFGAALIMLSARGLLRRKHPSPSPAVAEDAVA